MGGPSGDALIDRIAFKEIIGLSNCRCRDANTCESGQKAELQEERTGSSSARVSVTPVAVFGHSSLEIDSREGKTCFALVEGGQEARGEVVGQVQQLGGIPVARAEVTERASRVSDQEVGRYESAEDSDVGLKHLNSRVLIEVDVFDH